jgi:uncharacterized protein DUF1877
MPIVCRLIQIDPAQAAALEADHRLLADVVAKATRYGGVYRYWHGIQFLLERHQTDVTAARWLELGVQVSESADSIPGARVLPPGVVAKLVDAVREVEPDALFDAYDAAALDAAGIYPRTWVAWEEDFDSLGQTLSTTSYCSSLPSSAPRRAPECSCTSSS